jgi:hypothetical protein
MTESEKAFMPRRKIFAKLPATLLERIQIVTTALVLALSAGLLLDQSAVAFGAEKGAVVKRLTDNLISLKAQHGRAANHLKPTLLARLQNLAPSE